jgi:hypothetical protein
LLILKKLINKKKTVLGVNPEIIVDFERGVEYPLMKIHCFTLDAATKISKAIQKLNSGYVDVNTIAYPLVVKWWPDRRIDSAQFIRGLFEGDDGLMDEIEDIYYGPTEMEPVPVTLLDKTPKEWLELDEALNDGRLFCPLPFFFFF